MPKTTRIKPLDFTMMEGGLRRMLDRLRDEGLFTGEADEDAYLHDNPVAILLGLLYDQRVRAEYAFTGPRRLHTRLGHLDLAKIAKLPSEKFQQVFAEPPAVHRFTNKMADYTQQVAAVIVEEYNGDPARIWNDGADFDTVQKRLLKLPGFGKGKAAKMRFVLHYLGYRDFSE